MQTRDVDFDSILKDLKAAREDGVDYTKDATDPLSEYNLNNLESMIKVITHIDDYLSADEREKIETANDVHKTMKNENRETPNVDELIKLKNAALVVEFRQTYLEMIADLNSYSEKHPENPACIKWKNEYKYFAAQTIPQLLMLADIVKNLFDYLELIKNQAKLFNIYLALENQIQLFNNHLCLAMLSRIQLRKSLRHLPEDLRHDDVVYQTLSGIQLKPEFVRNYLSSCPIRNSYPENAVSPNGNKALHYLNQHIVNYGSDEHKAKLHEIFNNEIPVLNGKKEVRLGIDDVWVLLKLDNNEKNNGNEALFSSKISEIEREIEKNEFTQQASILNRVVNFFYSRITTTVFAAIGYNSSLRRLTDNTTSNSTAIVVNKPKPDALSLVRVEISFAKLIEAFLPKALRSFDFSTRIFNTTMSFIDGVSNVISAISTWANKPYILMPNRLPVRSDLNLFRIASHNIIHAVSTPSASHANKNTLAITASVSPPTASIASTTSTTAITSAVSDSIANCNPSSDEVPAPLGIDPIINTEEIFENKLETFEAYLDKHYTEKVNRGFFHRHGDEGKANAFRCINKLSMLLLDRKPLLDALEETMRYNPSGNYHQGSFRTLLLAFHAWLNDDTKSLEDHVTTIKSWSTEKRQKTYETIAPRKMTAEVYLAMKM